ncbi:CPBP family intramembrane metalloprotease [Candidatus Saccharibacteria bacterium]|nr:CPBP family intramembrane metalloprotease [Candidatus Saccharibacteria bacterium]
MAKPLPEFLRVPWTVPQSLGIFVTAWFALPVGLVVLIVALAQVFSPVHTLLVLIQGSSLQVSFIFDLITAVTALGLVWLALRHYQVGWAEVGWRKFDFWKTALYLVGGFVGFTLVAALLIALVSYLVPSFNANQAQSNDFTGAVKTHVSLTLIALVLIPPIIEETVFRGFIFPAIAKKWGVWGGAIASSVLFGLAHWQANVSIYTFVLGLVLCFLYVKLKSIFPGMLIHMLNNLLAFYALASK